MAADPGISHRMDGRTYKQTDK